MPNGDLEALLTSATYDNTAATPATSDRFFSFSVSDGTNTSNIAQSIVNVRTDAPPVIDLDTTDSPGPATIATDDFSSGAASGGSGWANNWQEEVSAANINFTAGTLELRNPDQLARVTRTVDLSGFVDPTISFDYSTSNNLETNDDYVIEVSTDGGTTWTVIVNSDADGNNNNVGTISNFSLGSVGTANTIFRARFEAGNGDNSEYFRIDNLVVSASPEPSRDYATSYVQNAAAVAIASANVAITDADSTNLLSATITLTNVQTGDLLSLIGALPAGIATSTYNAGTGSVTLTGAATLADYQTAIEAIGFSGTGGAGIDQVPQGHRQRWHQHVKRGRIDDHRPARH